MQTHGVDLTQGSWNPDDEREIFEAARLASDAPTAAN
jgi:hypothetical protein